MPRLSDKHRKDMQKYVDYYKGKEEMYDNPGWPMSIAYALEAALKRIDELEGVATTATCPICQRQATLVSTLVGLICPECAALPRR